jgi:hypothetical protein
MAVYDVNGDGLNDVVTSLQAHGRGPPGLNTREWREPFLCSTW